MERTTSFGSNCELYERMTFICPICGAMASIKVASKHHAKIDYDENIRIEYKKPRNCGFELYCHKHDNVIDPMIGLDEDNNNDIEFVKAMINAGIYIACFSIGDVYGVIKDTSDNNNHTFRDPLHIVLHPSSTSGVSFDSLTTILTELISSDKKYTDVIHWGDFGSRDVRDISKDYEKFDNRAIWIGVRSNYKSDESYDNIRSTFINFYETLTDRVNEEMKHIEEGTSNE